MQKQKGNGFLKETKRTTHRFILNCDTDSSNAIERSTVHAIVQKKDNILNANNYVVKTDAYFQKL